MSPQIKKAPLAYDGTLGELYDGWVEDVLLDPSVVEKFHNCLSEYLDSADPLYLVRKVGKLARGETVPTENGAKMRPTDNSPAWWIHSQLFSGDFMRDQSFEAFIDSVPCHFHEVRIPFPININKSGWHVAHIHDVKNGDVEFLKWDRSELARRMARNIHPCNYFYIPKGDWQHYGRDRTVIGFFYQKFESLYKAVWKDFLGMVAGKPNSIHNDTSNYRYSYSATKPEPHNGRASQQKTIAKIPECAVQYSHSRLCFKADMIEPLSMEQRFCIQSNVGTFIMTKLQFYETFPNVVETESYKQDRIYHYRTLPKKALRFKVDLG